MIIVNRYRWEIIQKIDALHVQVLTLEMLSYSG
jgi:hypothetical protein